MAEVAELMMAFIVETRMPGLISLLTSIQK
jgi:hypothetical protein